LETKELIGTIGLGWKTFESDFTPCVDIGWRIGKKFWNQGLATEGASACLNFAQQKQITEVLSMASIENTASIQVMKKIGMSFWKEFDHPELKDFTDIQRCSLYRITF
jgi:RimJ/RimL family protein N-acetyltransferase